MNTVPDAELAVEDTEEVAEDEIDEADAEEITVEDEIEGIEEISLDEVDEGDDEDEDEPEG
jgi:hypothetical protein